MDETGRSRPHLASGTGNGEREHINARTDPRAQIADTRPVAKKPTRQAGKQATQASKCVTYGTQLHGE